MNRQQRTSRYFLAHLLPREALSAVERERLERTLRGGEPQAERALAAELAEALAARGVFRRLHTGTFRHERNGQSYRLGMLGVPATDAVGPPAVPAAPAPGPPPAEPALEHLREVLAVLRLQGRQPGILSGLARLLAALRRWYPGCRCTLYHFQALDEGDGLPDLVPLEPDTLAAKHPYRLALAGEGLLALDPGWEGLGWYPPQVGKADGSQWFLLALRLPSEDGGAPWGLLELRLPAGALDASLPAELGLLGEALSELVHNHRVLASVVYVDGLTQVYNRSFLELQLPLEIERATRNSEPLAMLVVDLDDFKQINDRHGHEAGDRVLRSFGAVLRETLRRVDLVFRFGGEEFVVLLPRLDEESALRAAERLRLAVAEHPFAAVDGAPPLSVTASIGGALYPRDAVSERSLFREADAACYRAKRDGKNRVTFALSPDEPAP
jgi:diguanylate cyclase (GGDEF)-like protein